MIRLACAVLGHRWLFTTEAGQYVKVMCSRCGAVPVWRTP